MKNDRHPRIGDYLLVSHDGFAPVIKPPSRGIVVKIERDKWHSARNVFIAWQTEAPPEYQSKYGYDGSNIHNLRSKFRVFRDGEEIK